MEYPPNSYILLRDRVTRKKYHVISAHRETELFINSQIEKWKGIVMQQFEIKEHRIEVLQIIIDHNKPVTKN